MKHVVVGTAGHIDHGKTSLVKALTGTDTDRLPEEKARGITIDLGFAFLEESDGLTVEIVDVPGHERFVKNMLAGVGGIDLALMVIAADEGVMPQTREHLAICSLLRIKSGLVALTKTDLAEPDWLELVQEDVRALLEPTFLSGCPIVPVSVKTGQGLGELRSALAELARAVPARSTDQTPRLPIDRVFTIRGFGTVVTGTLAAGRFAVEDKIEVYPRGVESRVRGLQVHGHAVEAASAGQRTALNLQGVERAAIERGDVVAPAGALLPALLADATLELLADAPRAAQGARPGALPRGHAGGDGPGPPRRPRGARAGPGVLWALPPGGADRRAARRPLRDPLLFPDRHDRGRHAARHRAAALQAEGPGPARAPAAPRPGHGCPGPGGAPPPGRARRERGRQIFGRARPSARTSSASFSRRG